MSIQDDLSTITVVVTVDEIDHDSVDDFVGELAAGLRRCEEMAPSTPGGVLLVIDLSQVSFLDSNGIRALIEADKAAMRQGGRVVLYGARGVVRRCLEITGVLPQMGPPG